jgi:UPF0755 protein
VLVLLAALAGAAGTAAWWALQRPLDIPGGRVDVRARPGTTLTAFAREAERAGLPSARWLPWLARVTGKDRALKAGRYQFESGHSLTQILDILVAGRVAMSSIVVPEGWTFDRLKEALRSHPDIENTTLDKPDSDLLALIGAAEKHPEGLFFPDTYLFASGTSDVALLRRAYGAMQQRLAEGWAARAGDLPYENPYQALVLASIIEKETGRSSERGLIASVFVNRLRIGMRLQTDPTVIYGLGERFDGNLRRRDLESDTAYNTYTRAGLPPTPIALPGQASIDAALRPPPTRFLYFVARGDGSSVFSTSLAEHNRAVDRFQRGGGGGPRS